jgi:CBS domain-containing protein
MNADPRGERVVGDLMAIDPVVVSADASLAEAARLMERHHISGLPVVDGAGSLVGVVSQTDLLRARATEYLWANWAGLRVKHLMTTPAITVHRSTPLALAARRMERHHVHRLVVVADADDGLPIGILSTSDLVRAMSAVPAAGEAARPDSSTDPSRDPSRDPSPEASPPAG